MATRSTKEGKGKEIKLPSDEEISKEGNWRFTSGHGAVDDYSVDVFINACKWMREEIIKQLPFIIGKESKSITEEDGFEKEASIEIGELLIVSPDEDGDFFIKIGKQRSTTLGAEEMKYVVKFLNHHIALNDGGDSLLSSDKSREENKLG